MNTDSNKQVALALLQEVEDSVNQNLGTQIAMPFDVDNYDPSRDNYCSDMVKQCDLAEKKAPDDTEVLFKSLFLKSQLYGCWQKPQGVRGTHKKAKESYEKMLQIAADMGGDSSMVLYRYALFCRVSPIGGKEQAIANFKRVIEIEGEDSEIGIECAKEIAKEEEKKGGCFLATACFGDYDSPEVLILRRFRDKRLLSNMGGRLFVSFYYCISPTFSQFLLRHDAMKSYVKNTVLKPIIFIIKKWR
jgi:hypothetical protein